MPRFLMLAVLPAFALAPAAGHAQGVGGHVVEDPYADFPPIRLEAPAPRPALPPAPSPSTAVPQQWPQTGAQPFPTQPPVGALPPAGVAPPLAPQEALGLIIQDRILRELDRVLPRGPARAEFNGGWRDLVEPRGRGRGRGRDGDDDDRWDDRDDDRDD